MKTKPNMTARNLKSEARSPNAETEPAESKAGSPAFEVGCSMLGAGYSTAPTRASRPQQRAAVVFLSRFLSAGFVLGLLVSGCAGPRPFQGGRATTTRNQAGLIPQSVAQGEHASQPSKQDQETIKVQTYTLPAATRIEQSPISAAAPAPARSQRTASGQRAGCGEVGP
jgi:hypothetical protein